MLGLTSHLLVVLAFVVAALCPVLVAYLWWRRPARRAVIAVVAVVAVLVGQLSAVAGVFLAVNDGYGFYSSWSDLLGRQTSSTPVAVQTGSRHPGGGRLEELRVHGSKAHSTQYVLAWLPKQYDERAYRHHRFPVVEFLPGQPEQPLGAFQAFHLAADAAHEIDTHRVPPFVLVVPPLMIRPPHDTECTNVPGGPQAASWLSSDVPRAITTHLRVQHPGRHWSVMGWSTGAFCAAKMLYAHPHEFASAVGIGGYYQPITRGSWPNLFGPPASRHAKSVRKANSPQWLYRHTLAGLRQHLLIVSSRQDPESWASTARMLQVTADSPAVGHVVLTEGGHNFRVYEPYVGPSLRWLTSSGSL